MKIIIISLGCGNSKFLWLSPGDLLAGRDIAGGRSGAYESKLREGRNVALGEMIQAAKSMGADAVIGIDVDYETVGQTMLMVCASGTAVTLKKSL